MKELFEEIRGADFSECGLYRFALWRIWDEKKPLIMFIGLNPSTANKQHDDPTIKRCRQIAKNLGYGGFYMCNCFSYISTNPLELKAENFEAMLRNERSIANTAASCKEIVFAWGNFKEAVKTGEKLAQLFPNAKALHINKNGSPKHPLYCSAKTQLVPFIKIF